MATDAKKPPFHDRDGYIWMDGKMLPWRDAKVHFLTHGLHYGTGVFEGERVYNDNIFKSVEHTERLINSGKIIHLPIEYSVQQIEDLKREVLEANNLTNGYIRVLAWRGSEQLGVDPRGAAPHIGIAAWDWPKYFAPELLEKGISLGTSKWRKPSPDSAPVHSKSCSLYNLCSIAKVEAIAAGYTDALMWDHEGYIAESTGANLFGIKDGSLFTPIADRFLNGITRQTVIQLAKDLGIQVTEKRIKPEEMKDFQEVFLTGTAAELTPVGNIDGHIYKPGAVTKKLQAAYTDLVSGPAPAQKAAKTG